MNGRTEVCAFALTVELDEEASRSDRDLSRRSVDRFGIEVGLSRLLDLLAGQGISATFLIHPALAVGEVMAVVTAGGHELGVLCPGASSGIAADDREARDAVEASLAALGSAGVEVAGHRAVGGTATWAQIEILAEFGFTWDSSLMDDDRPYRLVTSSGELVEVPPHPAVDDRTQFDLYQPEQGLRLFRAASRFSSIVRAELDAQRRYGGCVTMTVNPRRIGRAGRLAELGALLVEIRDREDVWFANLGELAAAAATSTTPRRKLDPPDPSLGPYG